MEREKESKTERERDPPSPGVLLIWLQRLGLGQTNIQTMELHPSLQCGAGARALGSSSVPPPRRMNQTQSGWNLNQHLLDVGLALQAVAQPPVTQRPTEAHAIPTGQADSVGLGPLFTEFSTLNANDSEADTGQFLGY